MIHPQHPQMTDRNIAYSNTHNSYTNRPHTSDSLLHIASQIFGRFVIVGLVGLGLLSNISYAQVNIQVSSKTAQLVYPGPGVEHIQYTLNIYNNSANRATGVVVSDFLMSGLQYHSANITISGATNAIIPAQATSTSGRQLYRNIGSMLPYQTAIITYSGGLISPEVSSGLMLWLDSQYITGLANNQHL